MCYNVLKSKLVLFVNEYNYKSVNLCLESMLLNTLLLTETLAYIS